MALEIYKEAEKKEKPTKIALVNENGKIYLAVVDDEGEVVTCGYMAIVSEKGIKLCDGFDGGDYGIAIENGDNSGYVATSKE